MPTIRVIQRPQDFHETVKTSHNTATETRNSDSDLPRRYAYSGPKSRETVVNLSECCRSVTTSWFSHQAGEVLSSSLPVSRVPGILDKFQGDDASRSKRETPESPIRVQECAQQSLADTERTLCSTRQDESLFASGSGTGSLALSCTTEATYQQRSSERRLLQQSANLSHKRFAERPPVVDLDQDSLVQQMPNLRTTVRHDRLHRSVQTRMGSSL